MFYYCNRTSGEFLFASESHIVDSGIIQTTIAPPEAEAGYARALLNNEWTWLEDLRGTTYWDVEGNQYTMTSLGALPDTALTTDPISTTNRLRASVKSTVSSACAASITSGFYSDALGSKHEYASDIQSQLNLHTSAIANSSVSILCAANNEWAFVEHTQEQVQQVCTDWLINLTSLRQRNLVLQEQIASATTSEQLNLISW